MSTFEPPAETLADVVLVDYGLGNLRSATRGLERAGRVASVEITDDPEAFRRRRRRRPPGVGAFREGMENAGPLSRGADRPRRRRSSPFGSVSGCRCSSPSEEADHEGRRGDRSRSVPGTNVRFDVDRKVPHMAGTSSKSNATTRWSRA